MPNKKLLKLKPKLDALVQKYEQPNFIQNDPIQFMHAFEDKVDQEIAGFFAAIMAWGRRDIVINKVDDLLKRMEYNPAEFVRNFTEDDATKFETFKHRTFKPIDIYWLIKILQSILKEYQDFESFWSICYQKAKQEDRELLAIFHDEFFAQKPEAAQRTRKHISNPEKNSTCKRLYMYLRWCLRPSPVDLGIWDFMPVSELRIPVDVHVARQAQKLKLVSYNQINWKFVLLLNKQLTMLDSNDPAKYDFALFGLGVES